MKIAKILPGGLGIVDRISSFMRNIVSIAIDKDDLCFLQIFLIFPGTVYNDMYGLFFSHNQRSSLFYFLWVYCWIKRKVLLPWQMTPSFYDWFFCCPPTDRHLKSDKKCWFFRCQSTVRHPKSGKNFGFYVSVHMIGI